MDVLVPDSWLRQFLKTKAAPKKIAECLSLCGPSVEKVEKSARDFIYHIEITTNRVDSAGVYGLAREAAAILPRFGIPARLAPPMVKSKLPLTDKVNYLVAEVDHTLCPRFSAILIKNVQVKPSPKWMQEKITAVGLRPLNNLVDVTNYLMHELGQPLHAFDYDKLKGAKMLLRESLKGEKVMTLDGKTHTLLGGDIVIEDGERRLIDLAGIMGGALSSIDNDTKNVLLFVQTYNPVNIRRTSMTTGARSEAASLFEKGLDPELVELTLRRAVDMLIKIARGKPASKILDLYPKPYEEKQLKVEQEFIVSRLGVEISQKEVSQILNSLRFSVRWQKDLAQISIPSFRALDINIPEDIVEEVARLYGYHNLPSQIMTGPLPEPLHNTPFEFEQKIKNILKGWGGIEIYTSSLTSRKQATFIGDASWLLKLKNPLGDDSQYLRGSLTPSLVQASYQNKGEENPFWLFEISNVYLPIRGSLPEEKMMLAGIFSGYKWRKAKGIVEALLEETRVEAEYVPEDARGFTPNKHLYIKSAKKDIGRFGQLEENGFFYFEADIETLRASTKGIAYKPIPKYPAQVEDLTLVLPPRSLVGELISQIKKFDKQIVWVRFMGTYKDTATFRIAYQNPKKTLTDKEVERIRGSMLKRIKKEYGVRTK